jgi:ubiquinone biosynthesis protein
MPIIFTPGKAYKHLSRYRQVVGVLTKYGFGEFFGQIRIWEYINIEKRLLHRRREMEQMSFGQRLRLALEELGPTFVKLGQMLSTRPDIVPQNLIVELEKLQNQVAPISTEIAKQVIETELGKPIKDIFSTFDDTPLAAASLAQVYRATIQDAEVVVKVQRPNIAQVIEVDLDVMHTLAALMERYLPGSYVLNPAGLVREFSDNIHKELDFRIEANNMRRFADNFSDTAWFHVPKVYPENCCTQRVLIMEYVKGTNIGDLETLRREGYDLKLVVKRGAEVTIRSALEYGFFHADPHPGNVVVLPGNNLCLLDYGMMGTLSVRNRDKLGRLLFFISSGDEKRTARTLVGLIESKEVIDPESLETYVSEIIQEYARITVKEIQFGNMFFRIFKLLQQHHARFPSHLIWLFKSLAALEDISRKLDPDFEFVKTVSPFVRRMFTRDFNPIRQTKEVYLTALDSADLLRDLPYDASVVLDQIKKGRVKIEFEHVGLDPLRRTIRQLTHYMALTIVIAALLIASALIVISGVPPLAWGIPVLGLVGFGISVILMVVLVIASIFR